MSVRCNQDCKHYKEAKENINSLDPKWRWAFESYGFVVPKAETHWFKCGIEGCEGHEQENWQRLNRNVPEEFRICRSCGQPLKQVNIEKEEVPEIWEDEEEDNEKCEICSSNEWLTDYHKDEISCAVCGTVDPNRKTEAPVSQIIHNQESWKEEKADMRLNPHLRKLLRKSKNRASSMKMSIEEQRDMYDRITVNRIISGGDKNRLTEILEGCEINRERWSRIALEANGRGVSNLPPRFCQCRKSKQKAGRPRMILHLHQILQSKGNVQSISNMLKLAGINPKHFQRFINLGPVGNHLPNLQLSDGRKGLREAAKRLIEHVDSLEANDLLLDEIEKQFDLLDDSEQFILSSNLENGLWSFRNNSPYTRENGYIIMMIPYAIAITRAIRSMHGTRFGKFIRRLGEMAMADAQFTKGELEIEKGWR